MRGLVYCSAHATWELLLQYLHLLSPGRLFTNTNCSKKLSPPFYSLASATSLMLLTKGPKEVQLPRPPEISVTSGPDKHRHRSLTKAANVTHGGEECREQVVPAGQGRRWGRHFFGYQEDKPKQLCHPQQPTHRSLHAEGTPGSSSRGCSGWAGHSQHFPLGSGSMAAKGPSGVVLPCEGKM